MRAFCIHGITFFNFSYPITLHLLPFVANVFVLVIYDTNRAKRNPAIVRNEYSKRAETYRLSRVQRLGNFYRCVLCGYTYKCACTSCEVYWNFSKLGMLQRGFSGLVFDMDQCRVNGLLDVGIFDVRRKATWKLVFVGIFFSIWC